MKGSGSRVANSNQLIDSTTSDRKTHDMPAKMLCRFTICLVSIAFSGMAYSATPDIFGFDASFAQGGLSDGVNFDGATDETNFLASDGKGHTYGVGGSTSTVNQFGYPIAQKIIRWDTASGTIDSSFGANGMLSLTQNTGPNIPGALCVDPQSGDILLPQTSPAPGGGPFGQVLYGTITRIDSAGNAVARWGINGVASAAFSYFGNSVVGFIISGCEVEQDGSVLVAGYLESIQFAGLSQIPFLNEFVGRLGSDGNVDQSFGSSGATVLAPPSFANSLALSVTQASDGSIYVLGQANQVPLNTSPYFWDASLARLNSNGSVDTGFAGGMFVLDLGTDNDRSVAIKVQADGKIVVVGVGSASDGSNLSGSIFRLNHDGSVDTTYNHGKVLTQPITVPAGSTILGFTPPVITQEGKIQFAASTSASNGSAAVVQLNGSADLGDPQAGEGVSGSSGGGSISFDVLLALAAMALVRSARKLA